MEHLELKLASIQKFELTPLVKLPKVHEDDTSRSAAGY